jgi:hypothetical protein
MRVDDFLPLRRNIFPSDRAVTLGSLNYALTASPRLGARTMYGWLPRDKGSVIFGIWSGAAMYSASGLRL